MFENDLLKTKEDITSQSREILQMFVWWGASSCPPVTNVCKISRLCRTISLLSLDVSPLNLVISDFKVLFPTVSMDIRLLLFIKSCKKSKPWKCLLAISGARFTPRQRSDHCLAFKSMNLGGNLCIDWFSSLFFFIRLIHLKDCMEYYQRVLRSLLLFLEMASEKLPSRDFPYVTE